MSKWDCLLPSNEFEVCQIHLKNCQDTLVSGQDETFIVSPEKRLIYCFYKEKLQEVINMDFVESVEIDHPEFSSKTQQIIQAAKVRAAQAGKEEWKEFLLAHELEYLNLFG